MSEQASPNEQQENSNVASQQTVTSDVTQADQQAVGGQADASTAQPSVEPRTVDGAPSEAPTSGATTPEAPSAPSGQPEASITGGQSEPAPKESQVVPAAESASSKATSKTGSAHSSRSRHSRTDGQQAESPRPSSVPRRKRMKLGELDLPTAKIGFIGAGKIAESTINGLIHYAKVPARNIYVAAPAVKDLEKFKALGCRVTKRNYDIFGRYDCDIVFLAFHGYVIKHCYKLGGSRPHPLTTNYIPHQRHPVYVLSMVSGVSMSQIKACLLNPDSSNKYVIEMHRIMLNTAVGHGLGICAIDCEPDSKKLSAPIRQLLSSFAQLEHVPASQMDAACAIGGSGLAFSYYFINALADGAFRMGLSRAQAIRFASKTAQCAAQTLLESGKHPAELRDTVSSPSGAALYGIHVLEKNDVASGVTAAVEAAHKRAHDLATQDVSA